MQLVATRRPEKKISYCHILFRCIPCTLYHIDYIDGNEAARVDGGVRTGGRVRTCFALCTLHVHICRPVDSLGGGGEDSGGHGSPLSAVE